VAIATAVYDRAVRKLLVIVCGAVALTSLGGASAADIDWRTLPHMNYLYQRLKVSTNSTWQGAHPVDASRLNLGPDADSTLPKVKRQWIWAATCGPAAQRVVFAKTFLAPGVPLEGTLDFMYGPGNQFLGGRPYVSGSFQINGIEAGRLGDTGHFPKKFPPEISIALSPRALKAFRYGPNTVTIRVDRAPLPAGEQRCTRPWATRGGKVRYIAVAADLALNFGSDLKAIASDAPTQVAHVTNGQSVTLQGTARFQNDGPSSSLGGSFTVGVRGDGGAALALAVPQAPLAEANCERTQGTMTCTYDEVRVGVKTGIQIVAGVKVNTGFFKNGVGEMSLQWSVRNGTGRDPNSGNNLTETLVVLCAPGATDPRCA
jgi:hypothetical protein